MLQKADPAPSTKRTQDIDWKAYVEAMKAAPNEFHIVGQFSPGVSHHLRQGKIKAFLPDGYTGDPLVYMRNHWEITSRTVTRDPHRVAVYCKYLP